MIYNAGMKTLEKILVTGAAGFIGAGVCRSLLARGDAVTGLDNLSDYYDVGLKRARLEQITKPDAIVGAASATKFADKSAPASREKIAAEAAPTADSGQFHFREMDIANRPAMEQLFAEGNFDKVVNLAAQPGVRYSIENPHAYVESNIVGFLNVLEGCRHNSVGHLVYASSSSVYGANESMPFSVQDNVDHPVSLYAASKKSNEAMAHAYAHLYGLPTTGLRFFTVYGPWSRPDMAPALFTRAILAGDPINVFNYGKHRRDFTYIDDIVEGVLRALDRPATPDPDWSGATPDPAASSAPWRLYNIGSNNPVELGLFIETLEKALGKKAKKNLLPLQPGDVPDTYADVQSLVDDLGYQPTTELEEGVARFVVWYRAYYKA
jgi:UDP-glucuronate 4-epimerase